MNIIEDQQFESNKDKDNNDEMPIKPNSNIGDKQLRKVKKQQKKEKRFIFEQCGRSY